MKRINKLLLIVFLSNISFAQNEKSNSFSVFVYDDKGKFTNIRQTPNGTIMFKINKDYTAEIILNVIDFKKDWVHNSVIGIGITHDIYLLATIKKS